jgi:hypothetical protein
LFEFPVIDALREQDAIAAIVKPALKENVSFEEGALRKILDVTLGYPSFLQEWGKHCWDSAENSPIHRSDVDTAFTVPMFDEFMRRNMPGDDWRE